MHNRKLWAPLATGKTVWFSGRCYPGVLTGVLCTGMCSPCKKEKNQGRLECFATDKPCIQLQCIPESHTGESGQEKWVLSVPPKSSGPQITRSPLAALPRVQGRVLVYSVSNSAVLFGEQYCLEKQKEKREVNGLFPTNFQREWRSRSKRGPGPWSSTGASVRFVELKHM